jgi:mono/diheme cytochrome c family protein
MLPKLSLVASTLLLVAFSPSSFADDDLYLVHCAQCHQKTGAGLPGQFPRLSGRFDEASNSDQLREYLIKAVMFGQAGRMVVDGQTIIGAMPALGLNDEELASVLDAVVQLGTDTEKKSGIFSVEEIARIRAAGQVAPSALFKLREQLVSENILR